MVDTSKIPDKIKVEGKFETQEIRLDGLKLSPAASIKVRDHSLTGFGWGYGGSGPAQLALAILLKYLPKKQAVALYYDFKFDVVAAWPQTDFATELDLKDFIENLFTKNPGLILE